MALWACASLLAIFGSGYEGLPSRQTSESTTPATQADENEQCLIIMVVTG